MPKPEQDDDDDARVALAIVDGEVPASSVSDEHPGLIVQLENIQQIMSALDSIGVGSPPTTPPPVPMWGPFILKEQVGKGSFGVVCRGFDPAVAREIAVKLYSSPDLPSEPRLMARVHHPNVVTVFGAAVHDGRPGIWMELVRGRTLAERVHAQGPLPAAEAIRIGIELCRALEAVHDAHLVHQDVKARNVMERDDGGIVLMDFGAGTARRTSDEAPSRVTGTPLYMAPEVVLGESASARSDVYSLGVLLYYLLTGTFPVTAASWTELRTLYTQRKQPAQPHLTARLQELRPDISRSAARCVGKALAGTKRRYSNARELRRALEAMSRPDTRRWAGLASPRHGVYLALVLMVAALGAATGYRFAASRAVPEVIGVTRLTGDAGLATDAVRSADGKLLVYASDRSGDENLDIWVQRTTGAPIRLTRDPADESQPSVSPDGSHVVYRSERDGGGIYLIPAFGGDARLIVPKGRHPRFSPDGRRIAYLGGQGYGFGTLWIAPVSGGSVRQLAVEGVSAGTVWSPDGKHLLFPTSTVDGGDWWVARIPDNNEAQVAPVRTHAFAELSRHGIETITSWPTPCDWQGDRVLFHARRGDTTNIWEVGLSPSFLIEGPPRRLTLSTEDQLRPSAGPDGSILFSSRNESPYLWELRLDTDQRKASAAPEAPIRLTPHHPGHGVHDLSADGRRMALLSPVAGHSGVLIKDLHSGLETVVTTPDAAVVERYPVISRDGTQVLYGAIENGEKSIRRVSIHGGIPERICQGCGPPTGWSPDQRYVLIQHGVPARASLGVLDTVSGQRSEILKHATRELYRGGFSPDGRWVVFHAALLHGATREFIVPFRGLSPVAESDWIAVTDGNSWTDAPRWSPDGDMLYYVSDADGFRCIWAQPLDPVSKRPDGKAFVVHHAHSRKHSISNVNVWSIELSVARGRLVFNMGEARGNIWLAHLKSPR